MMTLETLKVTLQEALLDAGTHYRQELIAEKTPLDKLRLNIDMTDEK